MSGDSFHSLALLFTQNCLTMDSDKKKKSQIGGDRLQNIVKLFKNSRITSVIILSIKRRVLFTVKYKVSHKRTGVICVLTILCNRSETISSQHLFLPLISVRVRWMRRIFTGKSIQKSGRSPALMLIQAQSVRLIHCDSPWKNLPVNGLNSAEIPSSPDIRPCPVKKKMSKTQTKP